MDNKKADQLIRRVAAGEMSALEELYDALSDRVFAFALSIVRNRDTAEDIMQDTFVRIYNAASGFSAEGAGLSWIMRITHNLAINSVRERKHLPPEELENESAPDSCEGLAVGRVLIADALEKLSDTERRIVVLHAGGGLTLGEIAQVLSEPLGTVKWRHASALKKLKRLLGEKEVTEQ